jgi:hypothetical protein
MSMPAALSDRTGTYGVLGAGDDFNYRSESPCFIYAEATSSGPMQLSSDWRWIDGTLGLSLLV